MDVISHGLIGNLIASFQSKDAKSLKSTLLIAMFAIIPDLLQVPLYLFLGYSNSRLFWIPLNSDWVGFRIAHPLLSALWEIPHSLLFVIIVVLPLVYFFRIPMLAFIAYLSHVIIDIFTHSGEWSVKIFYPLSYSVSGFSDAWAWPLSYMAISWAAIFSLTYAVKMHLNRVRLVQ